MCSILTRCLHYATLLLGSLFCLPAMGASLQVSPVTLTLKANQASDSLWLTNSGSTVLQAQTRVFTWTQENGESVLAPTTDLVASPPMIRIEPGQRQLVRIIRVNGALAAPSAEQTFRVILDELPVKAATGVQFVLRYSLPVFIAPPEPAAGANGLANASPNPPALKWSVERQGQDILLKVVNDDRTRALIADAHFTAKDGKKIVLSSGLYGYVLAKNTRTWKLNENGRAFIAGGALGILVNEKAITIALPPLL